MIDNIYLIGVDDSTIDKMIDNLGYDVVLNMACNYRDIKSNLDYLKEIGISNIGNILIHYGDDLNDLPFNFQKYFMKRDILQLVKLINENYIYFKEIFE